MTALRSLAGKTAIVTGASQGIGRGIVLSLAGAGATVYFTGRNQPSLQAVAAEAAPRGGRPVAVVCDHTDDRQVEAFFARVRAEQGGLDLLVNNAWGGYEAHPYGLGRPPFWEIGLDDWEAMFVRGLRPALAATRLAVPLLLGRPGGLIVHTIAWDRGKYLLHLYYDLVKHATARMTYGMALELRPRGIAAVALAPGFVRTERVIAAHAQHPFDLSGAESPEYIGRAVVHLLSDPALLERTGETLIVGDLARHYGFTDVDGRQPPPFHMPPEMALD